MVGVKDLELVAISEQELERKLELVADYLKISKDEMMTRKINDKDMEFIIKFISENLYDKRILRLDEQIQKMEIYFKENYLLEPEIIESFLDGITKLRTDFSIKVRSFFPVMKLTDSFEVVENNDGVTVGMFSVNLIKSYESYLFETNSFLVDVCAALNSITPTDFASSTHNRFSRKRNILKENKFRLDSNVINDEH